MSGMSVLSVTWGFQFERTASPWRRRKVSTSIKGVGDGLGEAPLLEVLGIWGCGVGGVGQNRLTEACGGPFTGRRAVASVPRKLCGKLSVAIWRLAPTDRRHVRWSPCVARYYKHVTRD